ncbi:MAG: hypothetical protein CVV23_05615 [Ignavibacteriae bacterium HGW-Ignavibacteriae-2]|nr:MAG: hypothetical protein CVV23_05615 [Ignavibacteriae bacterium HGW-Ignavibacteriae-2]
MKLQLLVFFIVYFMINILIFSQIKFSDNFESGNIESITTTDSVKYYVTTKSDVGGRWFYFKISGVKNKYIYVKINNSDANRPVYSYDNVNFERFTSEESPSLNVFQKTFSNDSVFIAYYNPYTFSYLQDRIEEWGINPSVKIDTLGFSPNNFPMQQITITDFSVPDDNKYSVWIHARTHPGETPSSFQFDGLVQKLIENDDVIDYYRKNIIFYLIPFNNPEGVYYGRSRTNYYNVDQEREWNKTPEQTASEVQILKTRLKEICDQKPVDVFLNLHSQSSPYCTFWIHTPGSTSDYFYRREYQFSNLNISDNPYFQFGDYSESNLASHFPEGWLWANYGEKTMALTYETPYDHYSNGEWVTNENLYELGYRTIYSIGEYLELSPTKHQILDNTYAYIEGEWNNNKTGLEFYSDDFLVNSTGSGSVEFTSEALPAGKYDVYAWWPTSSANSYKTQFELITGFDSHIIEKTQKTNGGQWNFLKDLEVKDGMDLSVKINSDKSGLVAADAIRIIYRGPLTTIDERNIAESFYLYQNYPNPFNPSTTIRFELKESQNVILNIFNPLGQLVETLTDRYLSAGSHEFIFNAAEHKGLSSGVYYYQLTTESYSQTKGMVLVK